MTSVLTEGSTLVAETVSTGSQSSEHANEVHSIRVQYVTTCLSAIYWVFPPAHDWRNPPKAKFN